MFFFTNTRKPGKQEMIVKISFLKKRVIKHKKDEDNNNNNNNNKKDI